MNKENNKEMNEEEILENENSTASDTTSEAVAEETTETKEKTLEEQLAEAKAQIDDLKDMYLRQAAEFDNYRKRTIKEKAEFIKNGGERVITDMLPFIDDLDRAYIHMDQMKDLKAVKEGVKLIIEKFMNIMKKEGLEKIEAVNQPFDVDVHEAIAMVPGQPEQYKGKVLDCVQTGYKLNDKVIRHAKVAVGE